MDRAFLRVTALACLLGGVAYADPADPEVEAWDLLQRGEQLFKNGDYSQARQTLERSRQLVPDRAPTLYRWLGLIDVRLGRCTDAISELDRFLATAPADQAVVSETRAAREECQRLVASRGRLRVESTPPGAEVRFDVKDSSAPPLGVTPYSSEDAPLGDHLLRVTLPGHEQIARIISIAPGRLTTVRLDLWRTPDFAAPVPKRPPAWKRPWFWPVVATGIVVVSAGLGVGLGVGLSKRDSYPALVFQ